MSLVAKLKSGAAAMVAATAAVAAGFRAAARLAGQREDVLTKALHDFKSGARMGSGVASMADVVYELNDADMQALAHYMATRP